MMRLHERSGRSLTIAALLGVALVGTVDYLTGPLISTSIFYLPPVAFAAWVVGLRAGVVVSTASALVWLTAELANMSHTPMLIVSWNATSKYGIFLVVTFMLVRLRRMNESLDETVKARTAALAAEVCEHERAERRLSLQYAITHVLASGGVFADACEALMQAFCSQEGWDFGKMWLLNASQEEVLGGAVHSGAIVPETAILAGSVAVNAPDAPGLVARTWKSGEACWVTDDEVTVGAPADWAVYRTAVAFPVRAHDEITGIAVLFARSKREADADFLRMLLSLGAQIGDFVERKRAEQIAREHVRFIRRVADMTPGVVYVFDVIERKLLYVNSQFTTLFGLNVKALHEMGTGVFEKIVHPDDLERESKTLLRAFAEADDEAILSAECRARDVSGRWRWFRSRNVIFTRTSDGRSKQVLGAAEDITEKRRLADEARRHQLELMHVSRLNTAGELAAGIAHELNQPLAAIASFADGCVVRLQSGNSNPSDLLHVLQQISAQALRAAEVVSHLRDFVRKRPAKVETFDLNELLEEAGRLLSIDARMQSIRLEVALTESPVRLRADRVQVVQVLLNLILNAFDALPSANGSQPRVRIAAVLRASDLVEVSVEDNGRGFSSELTQCIFEPFFTTKEDGMGIGLAISRSIVEAHGGRLWANANPDGGATFCFTLPVLKG